jgi:flagella basal body P-ring formation protein FlgA
VLREGMVRPAQVFSAGAQVRVVAQGPGFEVTSLAQALSAGVVGQTARVRMDNGRIASGTVVDARTVLLAI